MDKITKIDIKKIRANWTIKQIKLKRIKYQMKQYGERLRRKAIMALSKNLTEESRKGKKLGILAVAVPDLSRTRV